MAKRNPLSSDSCLPAIWDQIQFLNETTIFIWICGIAFTKFSAGVWLGERPVVVLLTILTLVYLYMHLGRYHASLVRFPFVLLILYLGHTHLIQPGNLLLAGPFLLSWKHLLLAWIGMNSSFLFCSSDARVTDRSMVRPSAKQSACNIDDAKSNKVIPIQKSRAV